MKGPQRFRHLLTETAEAVIELLLMFEGVRILLILKTC